MKAVLLAGLVLCSASNAAAPGVMTSTDGEANAAMGGAVLASVITYCSHRFGVIAEGTRAGDCVMIGRGLMRGAKVRGMNAAARAACVGSPDPNACIGEHIIGAALGVPQLIDAQIKQERWQ